MKNNVAKNTAMLYLLNIAKMVFPLLTLPYLTRVLSVECYGVVSYVKAVMQYMQLIVDFGFLLSGTKAIVLIKNDKEKLNYKIGDIFGAKIILSIISALILLILILFLPILRANIPFTLLSFLVVFLTNFIFDFLFRGLEKMEIITIRFVIMKGLATALTFLFIRSDLDILWIPILDIIGSLIAIVLVLIEIRKMGLRIKFSSFKSIILEIKESTVYFFSNIATTAFMALNTLLIGVLLDESEVAYWSVCMQIVTAIQALYTPLTDGIYPQMVKTKDFKLIKKSLIIYLPLIVIGCILLFFFSKLALFILGGEKYYPANTLLRCLIPVVFFSFLSMLFGWPALGAIGKQKENTIATIITAIVQILGLLILIIINRFNLISIAILRSATELLLFSLRFGVVLKNKSRFTITHDCSNVGGK